MHDNKNIVLLGDIESNLLATTVSKYILDKKDMLNYVTNLESNLSDSDKTYEIFIRLLVKVAGVDYISSLCIYNFLLILSQQDTKDFYEDSEFFDDIGNESSLVSVAVRIGKSIVRRYLSNILKAEYVNKDRPKYSVWIVTWKDNNPKFNNLLKQDDKFYSILGSKLLDILKNCHFIKNKLTRVGKTNQHYNLVVYDDKLKSFLTKQKIYAIPTKLPMIVKPKDHDSKVLGGYLLNDIEFKEDLFIGEKAYSINSGLSDTNQYIWSD